LGYARAFMEDTDLEYGGQFLRMRYRRAIAFLRSPALRRAGVAAAAVTVALLIKMALLNADRVLDGGGGFSLTEEPYMPFYLSDSVVLDVGNTRGARLLPIPSSAVNRKVLAMNLEESGRAVRAFLEASGNDCVHGLHFGVPFDVMYFRNATMVNPVVVSQSDTQQNVAQESLSGARTWARRATSIDVDYIDSETLAVTRVKLDGPEAFCFAFYK